MAHSIQDAHTHLFSRTFYNTLAGQSTAPGTVEERLAAVTARTGLELPPEDATELMVRWLDEMDRAGVESMLSFASLPEEADVVADVCRASGGRLHGAVVVNAAASGAAATVERALDELDLRAVVLFPALHHYEVGDDACQPVLETVRAHGGWVIVHCGVLHVKLRDLLGLESRYDARYANPLNVVRAASTFPDVPFVIPHFGGGMLRETLLAGSWTGNIHVDTSSSNGWMASSLPALDLVQVFERALAVFGSERILYGTDSSTLPRGYRSDLLTAQLEALDALDIADDDRARILGGNLEALLARRG